MCLPYSVTLQSPFHTERGDMEELLRCQSETSFPDNSPLRGQSWATSGKSVGPAEAVTGGPQSFCPLGQRWPTSGNTLVEILQ